MSVPIIDSSKWKPCASWSENLTNNTKYLQYNKRGEPIWKPSFNPFANSLPSYEFDFSDDDTFDYISGHDPWGRPFVKSIFYFQDNQTKPQRTALWRVLCGTDVKKYLEQAYNKSRVYKKFKLLGFTSINKEVVRLRINNITSDSLDKMVVKFQGTGNFLEWKPANYVDKDVDDKRPVPMWIV
tara:strand:+ start:1075 stop:1623 length:549 start_codon:yes stop_codon:yes gene_type:complete